MAKANINEHVHADIPLKSDIIPAAIAPIIPPTSNDVDSFALSSGPSVAINYIQRREYK